MLLLCVYCHVQQHACSASACHLSCKKQYISQLSNYVKAPVLLAFGWTVGQWIILCFAFYITRTVTCARACDTFVTMRVKTTWIKRKRRKTPPLCAHKTSIMENRPLEAMSGERSGTKDRMRKEREKERDNLHMGGGADRNSDGQHACIKKDTAYMPKMA